MEVFLKKSVLVIGDLMLDEYIYGKSSRISQEAPVPVVHHTETAYRLGGAGNVAANIVALGGRAVIAGYIGYDSAGKILEEVLGQQGIPTRGLRFFAAPTVKKTRIIANGQQIARVDTEELPKRPSSDSLIDVVAEFVQNDAEAIVIADYAKGVITSRTLNHIMHIAWERNLPVFLDPKISQAALYADKTGNGYYPFESITPNHHEAEGLSAGRYTGDLRGVATEISNRYACKNVLITRGEDGMSLFRSLEGAPMSQLDIPTYAREVFDVSGAGDTVIATLALAHVSGCTMETSAKLANMAAGIVVGKRGTATVTFDELDAAFSKHIDTLNKTE